MTLDQRESGTWGLASGMPWGVQAETCGSLSVPSCSGLRWGKEGGIELNLSSGALPAAKAASTPIRNSPLEFPLSLLGAPIPLTLGVPHCLFIRSPHSTH